VKMGSKLDSVIDPDIDPYSIGQLEDLEDDQILELKEVVEQVIAQRKERCERFFNRLNGGKQKRARRKKAQQEE
jgi:hypothetical protein